MRESRVIAHLAHRRVTGTALGVYVDSAICLSYVHFARPCFSWRDLSCISRTCPTRVRHRLLLTSLYTEHPSDGRHKRRALLVHRGRVGLTYGPILRAYHRSTDIAYMHITESWIGAPGITRNITSNYRGKNYQGKLPVRNASEIPARFLRFCSHAGEVKI